MSLFRVYVDGALFYHPQMSKLAITDARIEEDAENIDSISVGYSFRYWNCDLYSFGTILQKEVNIGRRLQYARLHFFTITCTI